MEFDVLDCSVTPGVLNKSLAFDENKINAKIPFENQANEQTTIKGSEARRVGLPAVSWDAASGSQTPHHLLVAFSPVAPGPILNSPDGRRNPPCP